MLDADVADLIDVFASRVTRLPGVSRTNPHAFAEAKDDLAKAMMARARELRTRDGPRRSMAAAIGAGVFPAGSRRVPSRGRSARRIVDVEIRRGHS